jgi:hypothetical protein
MRSKRGLKSIGMVLLFSVAWCAYNQAGAAELKKKYPHPHAVHLEAMSQTSPELVTGEVRDWAGFSTAFHGALNALPLGSGARSVISGFKPGNPGREEKTVIVAELNRLLGDESLAGHAKRIAKFSGGTGKLEAAYAGSGSREDLAWMNRSILSDIFPQITRKKRTGDLKRLTCATCHEAWGQKAWGQVETGDFKAPADAADESAVRECVSQALSGEKDLETCVEMMNAIRKSRIEPYGPLKNYIQRSNLEEEAPFLVAVHPEDPYTFKPLLKKLVCVECHGQERKVTRVKGKDGKLKEIPVFYGLGSEKRRGQDPARAQKDEN